MVRPDAAAKVRNDPSNSSARKPHSGASYKEWSSFMSPNISDMYRRPLSRKYENQLDSVDEEMDIRKLLKDVERFGSYSMTWKERKAAEDRKVVALGGKAPKKHRTPLSVAIPAMKNQKKREQKQMEEALILGRFDSAKKKREEKRRPVDRRGLFEGDFRNGVLDVKHLLRSNPPPKSNGGLHERNAEGKKKGKGKIMKGGKRKGH